LKEARVHKETGIWILAIKRERKCLRPKPDLKIEAGDVLITSGYFDGAEDPKKLADPSNYCPE